MPKDLSAAGLDLGLGEGDLLASEVSEDEKQKKKRLGQLANTVGGPMDKGALNILGLFRG